MPDAIKDIEDARRVCDALGLDFGATVLDGVQGISWDLAVKLLDRAENIEDELDELKAEYERDKRDFEEAHDEIKCPECGCGVISDCEAAECGCDAPVCQRDSGKTLAEHYVSALAEVERLRGGMEELCSACIPSHGNHWDRTGQHGSGCPQCKIQWDAVNKARKLLEKGEV